MKTVNFAYGDGDGDGGKFIFARSFLEFFGLTITAKPHRLAGLEMIVSSLETEPELLRRV